MAPAVVKQEVSVPATKEQAATAVRRKGATPQQQKPRGLAEGIRTLRNSATLCDVLLVVGEEAFPAHQAMLSAMSPAFGVYLREAQPEPQVSGANDAAAKDAPVLSQIIDAAPAAGASAGSPTLTVSPPPTLPPTDPPPLAEETQASSYEAIARAALNVTDSSTEVKPAATTTATQDVAMGTAAVEEQAVVPAAVLEPEKQVKLRVHGISHPESLKIMLDYLYQVGTGCAWEYSPSNLEVNKEVLQLARQFELKHLSEYAARWLTKGLTTKNLVQRLVICEEFKLGALREKLIEQLTANPAELSVVCRSAEVLAHPTILQDLLVQVSALCGMATAPQKRSAPEETAEEKASEELVKEEKVEKAEKVERAEKAEKVEKVEKTEKTEKTSDKASSKVASKESLPEKAVKAEKEQPEKVSVKTSSKMQPLKKKRTT